MLFPSCLILSNFVFKKPVAAKSLAEIQFSGIFILFNALSVINGHTLYTISHPCLWIALQLPILDSAIVQYQYSLKNSVWLMAANMEQSPLCNCL